MTNGRKKVSATWAGIALAIASLSAAPASAQTEAPTAEDDSPYTCNIREDYYSCCPTWNPCTQYYVDSPLPPEEPAVKPPESPEE